MEFFDRDGNRLESPDLSSGMVWQDYMFVQSVEPDAEITNIPSIATYLGEVVFSDGDIYVTDGPQDEHVKDLKFVPFGQYEDKDIASYVMYSMISLDSWDVLKGRPWTQFRRYLPYSEQEKEQMKETQESEQFVKNGPEELEQLRKAIESLSSAFL